MPSCAGAGRARTRSSTSRESPARMQPSGAASRAPRRLGRRLICSCIAQRPSESTTPRPCLQSACATSGPPCAQAAAGARAALARSPRRVADREHLRHSHAAGPGSSGTRPSYELMSGCDTLLMVGRASRTRSGCRTRARRGASRSTRRADDRHPLPMEAHLAGDSKETLRDAAAPAAAQGGPLVAGADRGRRQEWGPDGALGEQTSARSTRRRSPPSFRRGCRTAASSRPTPGRPRTGGPGT